MEMATSAATAASPLSSSALATPDGPATTQQWRALRAEYELMKGKLARSRRDNDRLLHEVKAYRKLLDEQAKDLQDIRQRSVDAERLQGRLASAERELTQSMSARREVQAQLHEANQREEQLRSSMGQLSQITSSLVEKTAALEESQQELATTTTCLQETQARVEELDTALATLRAEHTALVSKHSQRERDFDLLLAEQRDTAAALAESKSQLQHVGQRASSDEEALAGVSDHVSVLRSQLAQQASQAAEIQANLMQQLQDAQQQVTEADERGAQQASALQAQLEDLRSQLAAAEGASSAVDELKAQLEVAVAAATDAKEGLARFQQEAQAEKMRQALAQADAGRKTQLAQGNRAALEEAESRLAAAAQQESALRAELDQQAAEVQRLQSQLDSYISDAEASAAETRQLRSKAAAADEVLTRAEELQALLDAERREAETWKSEAARSNLDRDDLLAQVQKLQGQLDEAKRVGRQEARDRENTEVELEMARTELASSQQRVEELEAQVQRHALRQAADSGRRGGSAAARPRQPGAGVASEWLGGAVAIDAAEEEAQVQAAACPSEQPASPSAAASCSGASSPAVREGSPAALSAGPSATPVKSDEPVSPGDGAHDVGSVFKPAGGHPIEALARLADLADRFKTPEEVGRTLRRLEDSLHSPGDGVEEEPGTEPRGGEDDAAEEEQESGEGSGAGSQSEGGGDPNDSDNDGGAAGPHSGPQGEQQDGPQGQEDGDEQQGQQGSEPSDTPHPQQEGTQQALGGEAVLQASVQQHVDTSCIRPTSAATDAGNQVASGGMSDDGALCEESVSSEGVDDTADDLHSSSTGTAPTRGVTIPRLDLSALPRLMEERDRADADQMAAAVAARARLHNADETSNEPGSIALLAPVVAPLATLSAPASRGSSATRPAPHQSLTGHQSVSVGVPFELPPLVASDDDEVEGAPSALGIVVPKEVEDTVDAVAAASPTGAWLRTPQTAGESAGTEAKSSPDAFFTVAPTAQQLDHRQTQDQSEGLDDPPAFFTCAPATASSKAAHVGNGSGTLSPLVQEESAAVQDSNGSPSAADALRRVLDFDV